MLAETGRWKAQYDHFLEAQEGRLRDMESNITARLQANLLAGEQVSPSAARMREEIMAAVARVKQDQESAQGAARAAERAVHEVSAEVDQRNELLRRLREKTTEVDHVGAQVKRASQEAAAASKEAEATLQKVQQIYEKAQRDLREAELCRAAKTPVSPDYSRLEARLQSLESDVKGL